MSGEEPDVETGQRSLADSESESSTYESAKDVRSISSEINIQIEESTEEPSLFDDGYHQTDFVLVYKPSPEKDSGPHKNMRQIFEANLEDEGLELEHVHQCSVGVNFVKIHAPWEVLTRYAEMIKMKMPMKEVPEFQYSRGDEKTSKGGISGVCHSISNLFASKTSKRQQFTTEYIRAREYLFDVPEKKYFFNQAQRSQIVDFILKRKRFSNNTNESCAFGITKLVKDHVYEAAFPLHEGECHSSDDKAPRKWLLNNWASFSTIFKKQPLDDIKEYFGVKIGLYFAWLGFYTCMLIPASAVGVLCFLYGFFTLMGDAHSEDVCENYKDTVLCPRCDIKGCKYEELGQTCTFVRITHLFDNGAAVFFAVFMSLWAVIFLELWKRYSEKITHHWDMTNFDTLEEHPRPEYLAKLSTVKKRKVNFITGVNEPCVSFWKKRVPCTIFSWSVVLLLCGTGGCLFELSLQLAIIVAGKQFINTVVEMGVPWLLRVYKKWSVHKKSQCAHENHAPTQWENDYNLINQEELGLFSEYLEMVLQFGFVTIFVVAFPLAPLFALLNNITEIRLDARKFITFLRRPVAERVKNIECTVW